MAKGFHTSSDVLTRTRDGQDLNAIWNAYQDILSQWNAERDPLVSLLTFPVTEVIEDVVLPGTEDFEEATEFGVPKAVRPAPQPTPMAYDFKWYDVASRFTFMFLADAETSQIDAVNNQILEADNRLVFNKVMKQLFNSTTKSATIGGTPYSVYPLANGDSFPYPAWKGTSFSSHNHYTTTNSSDPIGPSDLEALAGLVEEHGYTTQNGYNVIMLMNKAQTATVKTWRAGTTYVTDQVATYDFIPASGTAGSFILPAGSTLVGGQPANTFGGLNVVGTYGPYLIIEEGYVPAGYVVAAVTGGRSTSLNLIGLREHRNTGLRGLIQRPGDQNDYPLVNSYHIRGFGTGVRQRTAAAVLQVVNSASYTTPTAYA